MPEKSESKGIWDVGQIFEVDVSIAASELKTLGDLITAQGSSQDCLSKDSFFGLGRMVWRLSDELERISEKGFEMCRDLQKEEQQAEPQGEKERKAA